MTAFGAVFSDVDKAGSATLTFFDGDEAIGSFAVPAKSGESHFSFLGVRFLNRSITKVVVAHEGLLSAGQKDLSQGGPKDLVVLDDFIYSEPARVGK